MNIEDELGKYGLTEKEYELFLKDVADKTNKDSEMEWAEILDKYNINMHYDTLRKAAQPPLFGSVFVAEYYKQKLSKEHFSDYANDLKDKLQEIKKERYRLFDERNALNKALREEARFEDRLDKIENYIKTQGREQYNIDNKMIVEKSDNDLIVVLSDLHIGAEYYAHTGAYNSDIAKERLKQYLIEIFKIQQRHSSENCYVTIIGDSISGNIHQSITVTNRENVIEQIMKASALVTDFIYELSNKFNTVYVNSVNGNHSRLTKKGDAIKDERLDSLMIWYANAKLNHIDNIIFQIDQLDSTVATMTVRDNIYTSIHGDYDAFTDSAVAKLVLWLGFKPNCFIFGHKHFPAMSECQGISMVQCGSLGGSGDDYTVEKRLSGKPSQTVLVCNSNGIEACYPVKFK